MEYLGALFAQVTETKGLYPRNLLPVGNGFTGRDAKSLTVADQRVARRPHTGLPRQASEPRDGVVAEAMVRGPKIWHDRSPRHGIRFPVRIRQCIP